MAENESPKALEPHEREVLLAALTIFREEIQVIREEQVPARGEEKRSRLWQTIARVGLSLAGLEREDRQD